MLLSLVTCTPRTIVLDKPFFSPLNFEDCKGESYIGNALSSLGGVFSIWRVIESTILSTYRGIGNALITGLAG